MYGKPKERDSTIVNYINGGLRNRELCFYASASVRKKLHMETISSKIENYDDEIKNGNLLVVELAPLYLYAVMYNASLLDDVKQLLAQKISMQKKSQPFRFIGDAAGSLFENGEFDPCALAQQWWSLNFEGGSCLSLSSKAPLQSTNNDNYYYHYFYHHHIHFARAVRSTHNIAINSLGDIVYDSQSSKHGHNGRDGPPVAEPVSCRTSTLLVKRRTRSKFEDRC
ncbi:MAG TPA: hypothetical protein VHA09_03030 [Nitrososphaera sp.]|nr:hypothetical protein [Nitrososphaera sp.]